ncbi:MAG: hypothetical protein MUF54_23765, partial [Polyangiaceae bacterium]|nr:hypothetical protein [Polyangiaceae bacterium]
MTSGERRFRVFGSALLQAAVLTFAHGATAQRSAPDFETARTLYVEGKRLQELGDVPGALEKFRAAHALAGTPVTGIYLARAQEQLGRLIEARETCLGVARMSVQPAETQRSAKAREEAAALALSLEPRIAWLRVQVKGQCGSVTARVQVDGQELPATAVGLERRLNPGEHVVVVRAEGCREVRESLRLAEAERRTVTLTLEAPPAVVASPPTATAPRRNLVAPAAQPATGGMSPLTVTAFIVASSGAVVGSVVGVLAMSKAADVQSVCPEQRCPPEAHNDLDAGRTFG